MNMNPWTSLDVAGSGPYVLPGDLPYVRAYNAAIALEATGGKARPPTHIVEELVPEPWLGRRDAPVCLLLLNPGVGAGDLAQHADAAFRTRLAAAIADDDAPHFHLAADTAWPVRRWWSAALASMCRTLRRTDAADLQNAVSALQLFPYHSPAFGHLGVRLPSQAATITRVHEHLERRTLLIARSWPSWVGMVPELAAPAHAHHVIRLRGRGVRLHPNTLGDAAAFDRVVEAIRPRLLAR